LKTAGQEIKNEFRLDEDMFKEVRIFREITERWDDTSNKVKGACYIKDHTSTWRNRRLRKL